MEPVLFHSESSMTTKAATGVTSTAWSFSFKRGVECFRQNKYEEALELFSEAIRQKGNEKSIFDSRAAVFEKLDRTADALRDSKMVIDLVPSSWQGYARSARLFMKLGKFDASQKMADLALERLKNSDQKRREDLHDLKRQVAKAREAQLKHISRRAYHFGKLPVEIGSTIFLMVAEEDILQGVVLSQVCQHWRNIALSTPDLWRTLTLSGNSRKLKKAEIWLERSKGMIKDLRVRSNFVFSEFPDILRKARKSFWEDIDTLKLEVSASTRDMDSMLIHGASEKLRLRSLEFTAEPSQKPFIVKPTFWPSLKSMQKDTISAVTFDYLNVPWGQLCSFHSLRILAVRTCASFDTEEIFSVLQSNPFIEKLTLEVDSTIWSFPFGPKPHIDLPFLTQLELTGQAIDTVSFLSQISLPNLHILSIRRVRGANDFFPLLGDASAPSLTELHISQIAFDESALLRVLRRAYQLVTLEISHFGGSMHEVTDALAGRGVGSSVPICTMLEHVDFSHCLRLTSAPLVHLVKAHLRPAPVDVSDIQPVVVANVGDEDDGAAAAAATVLPATAPIRTLLVDGCPDIDPDVLPWLRAKVERVSCVYMTKSNVKKRR